MTNIHTNQSIPRPSIRLWPAVVIVALQWVTRFLVPLVVPDSAMIGVLGGVAGGLALLVWWLFFSRALWSERVGVLASIVAAVFLTRFVVHESIANGMMGMMLPIFSVPFLSLAIVASLAASRGLSSGSRYAAMTAAVLLACSLFTLVRTGGIDGAGNSDLHWRWTPSPEERLLAQASDVPSSATPAPVPASAPPPEKAPATTPDEAPPVAAAAAPASPSPAPAAAIARAEWPGFRGPERDSVIRGVRINTDWSASPPVEMWRRPIGPGWSSFAVRGNVLFTQEQRGDEEIVASYNVATGEPVWRHADAARFWESNGGAGPRGTPTLSNGRVYTLGATGIVNALDAGDGSVIWTRNAASDTGAENPGWGFSSSPLVVNDVVIVAASGRLVAYDAASGKPRWIRQTQGGSYSSPHLTTIDGVVQVLMLSSRGLASVAPADGTVLWEHEWPGETILQPAMMAGGDLLLATGGMGSASTRRVAVTQTSGGWNVQERWTSSGLKPYFNDFVVNKGHAFGFDGSILSCIRLEDGARTWKGGRYGHGQMVLLPDQDLMLVLSEEGELALVRATPDRYMEVARFKAIEGKTWNHPVLVGDVLLVRNGEEMAAFRLALANR